MMNFVSAALVESLHEEQIRNFGGAAGIRDRGLLESAIARAENRAAYDEDVTVAEAGAALAYGLIKNHPFIDGNKRTGYASLVVFLEGNGYQLLCPEAEKVEMVRRAAASEITEAEWTRWVASVVTPR